MALAEQSYRTYYDCHECGYFYFTTDTGTCYTECPQCGPTAKKRAEQRRRENQIRRLNEQLQAGIYE